MRGFRKATQALTLAAAITCAPQALAAQEQDAKTAYNLAVAEFECINQNMSEKLNRIKQHVRRVVTQDSGAIALTMQDGAIVFIQNGSGCLLVLAPKR
jgi:1,6-anhydro-N-acetylmuramate kinase